MDVIRDYHSQWNKPERDRQICNITYVWDLKYEINEPIYKAEGASQVALVVKNLPANAGDMRDMGSIPGSGRSPWGRHRNLLQYSCLENLPGQRSLAGYSPWGSQRVGHDWSDLVLMHTQSRNGLTDIEIRLVVAKGVGGREMNGLGVQGWLEANLLLEWINNKVLLYSTGNYIQCPGTNCNGNEYLKRIYVCI